MRLAALLIALPLCPLGCSPAQHPGAPAASAAAASGPLKPVYINEEKFGPSVHQLLLDGRPSHERSNLLAGVVRHQLERAARCFEAGEAQAGVNALKGAFYLIRAGEYHPSMVSGQRRALLAGAREAAREGNEGQALALYQILKNTLPEGVQQRDVEQHLEALRQWNRTTRGEGQLQAAGATQRAAVQRALLEASPEALTEAREATAAWIRLAIDSNTPERPVTSRDEREEALEYFRATRAGALEVIALYLRHGDPVGLLQALDEADLSRVLPPAPAAQLEAIAESNDSRAWTFWFRLFDGAAESERLEIPIDSELARAGAFGAAVGLYRSAPSDMRAVMPLAIELARFGMPEAAPRLLSEALDKESSPEELSWALALLLRMIVAEEELGQLRVARHTFEAAKPLLKLAQLPHFRKRVQPSAARLHYVMGALETRGGELSLAKPHVEFAARMEPSPEAYTSLAAINRQQGRADEAISALNKVIELARADNDAIAEAEALVTMFEIHRDTGDVSRAKQTLSAALERALEGQRLARSAPNQARAERLLARIMEYYGDTYAARRATDRAYEASRSDQQQLAMTILDASRRALTHRDLRTSREAVHRAVEANLPDEDIVYAALWLQLLERILKMPSDGTAEEALAVIDDASRWPAKLRDWSLGKLNDEQLLTAARNRVEQTEALFYTAMSKHAGKAPSALKGLEKVARSEAIELVEVRIARDLLAMQQGPKLDVELPSGVELP